MIKDEMYEVNCSHWYSLEGIIHIRIVCYIYVVDQVRVGSFSKIKSPTVRDVQALGERHINDTHVIGFQSNHQREQDEFQTDHSR